MSAGAARCRSFLLNALGNPGVGCGYQPKANQQRPPPNSLPGLNHYTIRLCDSPLTRPRDYRIHQGELDHEKDDIRGFYLEMRSHEQVVVGFESSGYAAWFEELLEETWAVRLGSDTPPRSAAALGGDSRTIDATRS